MTLSIWNVIAIVLAQTLCETATTIVLAITVGNFTKKSAGTTQVRPRVAQNPQATTAPLLVASRTGGAAMTLITWISVMNAVGIAAALKDIALVLALTCLPACRNHALTAAVRLIAAKTSALTSTVVLLLRRHSMWILGSSKTLCLLPRRPSTVVL